MDEAGSLLGMDVAGSLLGMDEAGSLRGMDEAGSFSEEGIFYGSFSIFHYLSS